LTTITAKVNGVVVAVAGPGGPLLVLDNAGQVGIVSTGPVGTGGVVNPTLCPVIDDFILDANP
jgi:hypothetical protein